MKTWWTSLHDPEAGESRTAEISQKSQLSAITGTNNPPSGRFSESLELNTSTIISFSVLGVELDSTRNNNYSRRRRNSFLFTLLLYPRSLWWLVNLGSILKRAPVGHLVHYVVRRNRYVIPYVVQFYRKSGAVWDSACADSKLSWYVKLVSY